jgi:L-threonylcarbamoyladenylate synthase
MRADYEKDIQSSLAVLQKGGVILFPTDTIWGLGCDATNETAVAKVLHIKQRQAAQGLIVLLADTAEISRYANPITTEVLQQLPQQHKPTTIIYEGGKNIAANILPPDQTIAIRLVQDDFCQELIRQFEKPLVSTSANIHSHPSPQNFSQIEMAVLQQVDYVVKHRQREESLFQPSTILKIIPDGFEVIRP